MIKKNKKLIIESDDFGLTKSISTGIIKGIKNGVITDTNVITTMPDVKETFEFAKENNLNKMGIHLNLDVGESLYYKTSFDHFIKPGLVGCDYSKIENEFFAQIECMISAQIEVTHITSHKALFVNYRMLDILIRLATYYNVPVRRLKQESFNKILEEKGIQMVDYSFINSNGTPYSLSLVEEFLEKEMKDSCAIEIVCHAGYNSHVLECLSSLTTQREKELELFTSSEIKDIIKKTSFELTNYHHLYRE